MTRYFKPASVTWWAGFVLLLSGVVEAAGISYGGSDAIRSVLDAIYGTVGPGARINLGIALIGLRGALGADA